MAADYFLEVEGIGGESSDDKHKEWIEVLSYSCGVSQPVSSASRTGGRTGGRADFEHFKIIKTIDKATPDLNLHCANGKHIPKIKFECCLATEDKHTFQIIEMKDVIVASVNPSGSSHPDENKPTEEVAFAYGSIKWSNIPIDSTGKAQAAEERTWVVSENRQG